VLVKLVESCAEHSRFSTCFLVKGDFPKNQRAEKHADTASVVRRSKLLLIGFFVYGALSVSFSFLFSLHGKDWP